MGYMLTMEAAAVAGIILTGIFVKTEDARWLKWIGASIIAFIIMYILI